MSDQSNRDFLAAATLALHSVESVAADLNDIKCFQSDGELYENNWAHGDADYRQRIRDVLSKMGSTDQNRWAGRSDIFEWIDRDLAPLIQAVNADFAKRYGWGAASRSDIKRSNARRIGGDGEPQALDSRPRPGTRGTSLAGLPAEIEVDGQRLRFGAFQPAQDAAAAYAKSSGIPYNPPQTYAKVDPARAKRIADAFEAMPHAPNDPLSRSSFV